MLLDFNTSFTVFDAWVLRSSTRYAWSHRSIDFHPGLAGSQFSGGMLDGRAGLPARCRGDLASRAQRVGLRSLSNRPIR